MLRLDIDSLDMKYNLTNESALKHSTKKVDIFPFNTHASEDFYNIEKILGEIFSIIVNSENAKEIDFESMWGRISENIESNHFNELKDIIIEAFFNGGKIAKFHPRTFLYLNTNPSRNIKKLGNYIFSVFLDDDEILEKTRNKYFNDQINVNNPLESLFFSALPDLDEANKNNYDYHISMNKIRSIFKEDYLFLIEDDLLYMENIDLLIKYYYFFYVTQYILKIDSSIKNINYNDISKIYFILDTESDSKSRISYKNGWNKLKTKLEDIFSYNLVFDIINNNNSESFIEIEELKKLSVENKTLLANDLDFFIDLYKEKITARGWAGYNPSLMNEDIVMQRVEKLFKLLKYQFENSARKGANTKYSKCFLEFTKNNFLKRSGRLGYSLKLTQEELLFFSKIVIKNDERLQLSNYWKKLSERGINFDRKTKEEIVKIFDEMNILEKESDSGDAKYVKQI